MVARLNAIATPRGRAGRGGSMDCPGPGPLWHRPTADAEGPARGAPALVEKVHYLK
jgi:hypothetical protein